MKNKCCCLILNYNDAGTTAKLVNLIKDYYCFSSILVVDNKSTDDSYRNLLPLSSDKIIVIQTDKNGGYGYGNNYGINYAYNKLGCSFVLIANPDVVFEVSCVNSMIDVLERDKSVGIVAPTQLDIQHNIISERAWKIPSAFNYALTFTSRGMRIANTHYDDNYFSSDVVVVDCVPGAMLMVNANIFISIGGYDTDMFLYCEEDTIGYKTKANGYKTCLLTKVAYVHEHGISISKSINSVVKQRILINKNKIIFMKKYLKANFFEICLARLLGIKEMMRIKIRGV